jgi:oligopeptide/dipeptide ABC transporter ATP-binding protein
MTALNPVFSVGFQIIEAIRVHRSMKRGEARREAIRLLELVAIGDPESRLKDYPHQLSGGQRQRVMIAMALACQPQLLIADEPSTALDVTVQAQIMELLQSLRRDLGLAVLLITHDLAVVAETCDRVMVMYAGRIVEEAPVGSLFESPSHPYTRALLQALPRLGARGSGERLRAVEGQIADPLDLPSGCAFHPRCAEAFEPCSKFDPEPTRPPGIEGFVRCHLWGEGGATGDAT